MTDHSDLIERLQDRAASYRLGGPSSEHTALLLDQAAIALSSQSLSLSEAREEIERLRRESADRLKCMDRRADRLIDLWDRVNAAERALGPFAAVASVDIGSDETDEDIFQQPGHYHRAPRITVGNMRRARTALEICKSGLADATNDPSSSDLSSLRKGAEVAVKPLEWVTHDPDCWYARCPVSSKEYYVIREDGRWWATWDLRIPAFDTAEEGKSAAQSDFETRIRSALIGGGQ